MKPLLALAALILLATTLGQAADLITPDEAKDHVGEKVIVRGTVVAVGDNNGHIFLNFGAPYPHHTFTGFISNKYADHIDKELGLQGFEGKEITIEGRIELHKGKPEIQITSPKQIKESP